MSNKYAEDGVDVVAGDSFSSIAGKICASTYDNCEFVRVVDLARGNFRGPRPFSVREGFLLDTAPDGVGTKVLLHAGLRTILLAAHDVLAMAIGDITRFGGLPAVFVDILKARNLGKPGTPLFNLYVEAMQELARICTEQNIVLHKGETAEMGVCVGSDVADPYAAFDWDGFALGVYREDKMILGDKVRPGNLVIALKDTFRSNGISSVREAFRRHYGDNFYDNPEAQDDLRAATSPSLLYDKMLTTAHGWYNHDLEPLFDLHLIAHITGGGFKKFSELLAPTGFSAVLDDLWDLPDIMRKCAEWRGFTSQEIYDSWNGGQGKLVVVPDAQADSFIDHAADFGFDAKVCGVVTPSTETKVEVTSKLDGEKLLFAA